MNTHFRDTRKELTRSCQQSRSDNDALTNFVEDASALHRSQRIPRVQGLLIGAPQLYRRLGWEFFSRDTPQGNQFRLRVRRMFACVCACVRSCAGGVPLQWLGSAGGSRGRHCGCEAGPGEGTSTAHHKYGTALEQL